MGKGSEERGANRIVLFPCKVAIFGSFQAVPKSQRGEEKGGPTENFFNYA